MVTAASTADLAIILIDARKGVLTQTRRHSYLAHLLGIPHIVVAVNKMDLVDYSPGTFAASRPTTWPSPPNWASPTCASSRCRRCTAT
jgi:sulfate adenylyltransferase subunit 1